MTQTSEYCSQGHPDRVADGIVSYLLDRYLEKDPQSRVALEAQVKDSHVTLGGEVTSAYRMGEDELKRHVRDAICDIGYTPEYAAKWGAENCIDPDALDVVAHIGRQSPDIAQGVDADGWGDQGIMWGMATDETPELMPLDHTIAKRLGMWLYESARFGTLPIGIDIKTQVAVAGRDIVEVVVAAPTREADVAALRKAVTEWLWKHESTLRYDATGAEVIVNGTGAYIRHASAGDCGTTGRKLVVDFYGGNCRIGGGNCWGKDPSKADVTLNVYARHQAVNLLKLRGGKGTVYCAISCCIGRKTIRLSFFDEHGYLIGSSVENSPAPQVVAEMGLNRPVFAFKCMNGLFAAPPTEGV